MAEEPILSKRLLPCAPDGEFSSFAVPQKVILDRDGLRIGELLIDPAYLLELTTYGQVLRTQYITASGSTVKACFLHGNSFTGKEDPVLGQAVEDALDLWGERTGSGVAAIEARNPRKVEMDIPFPGVTPGGDRTRVLIPSAKVAFPRVCPVCCGTATSVSTRPVSTGRGERGLWLVPVCEAHQVGDSIRVENWTANATELTFSFSNPDYAHQFARANDPRRAEDLWKWSPTDDRAFILYKYVISAIHVSMLLNSRVVKVAGNKNRVLPGLRYSLLTALIGWWAIPGIIYTFQALSINFKGGVDVTPVAHAALEGRPLSAYGVLSPS